MQLTDVAEHIYRSTLNMSNLNTANKREGRSRPYNFVENDFATTDATKWKLGFIVNMIWNDNCILQFYKLRKTNKLQFLLTSRLKSVELNQRNVRKRRRERNDVVMMMMMKEMMKMIMNIFSCVTAGWQKTKTLGKSWENWCRIQSLAWKDGRLCQVKYSFLSKRFPI